MFFTAIRESFIDLWNGVHPQVPFYFSRPEEFKTMPLGWCEQDPRGQVQASTNRVFNESLLFDFGVTGKQLEVVDELADKMLDHFDVEGPKMLLGGSKVVNFYRLTPPIYKHIEKSQHVIMVTYILEVQRRI